MEHKLLFLFSLMPVELQIALIKKCEEMLFGERVISENPTCAEDRPLDKIVDYLH